MDQVKSVLPAPPAGPCNIHISGRRDAAGEALGNSDKGLSAELAERRARDVCRGELLNVVA